MDFRTSLLREISITGNTPVTSSIYPSNMLSLSYGCWLLLPVKNLFRRFQRISNIVFLTFSVLQLLPSQLSPFESWSTIAPLTLLILISLIQDTYNDYLLYKKLKKLNEEVYGVWFETEFVGVKAGDLFVGQIILLNPGERVPADIVLLSRGNYEDSIFMDMTNLLGVTEVKQRVGIEKVEKLLCIEDNFVNFNNLTGTIKLAEPCSDYNSFYGTIKLQGHPSASEIKPENILFAGSKIKGSGPVIGFVAYCGVESKILLNSESYRKKYTQTEQTLNRWVVYILILICILVIVSVIGAYLIGDQGESLGSLTLTFTLLYSHLIPISLFVSIEIIRILQSYIFRRANPSYSFNTDNLNENLGQIDYLVTDKTFSLTKNLKKLKFFILNNERFINSEKPNSLLSEETERNFLEVSNEYQYIEDFKEKLKNLNQIQLETHFLKCLCLCNSLSCLNNEFLGLDEEVALVKAAEDFGFKLENQSSKSIGIKYENSQMVFSIIAHKPFKSDLKKARVLLEDILNNFGVFYAKGTPQAMLQNLNLSSTELDEVKLQIDELESRYCRVLVLGYKTLSVQELIEYKKKIKRIENSLLNSQGKIEVIFKQLEKNLKFIGLIGVSEVLDGDAIETVKQLKKSGIKVWLTSSDSYDNSFRMGSESEIIDPNSLLEIREFKSELTFSRYMKKAIKSLIYQRLDPIVIKKTQSKVKVNRKADDEENLNESFERFPRIANEELYRAVTFGEIELDDILNKPFDPTGLEFSVIIDRASFLVALKNEKCRKLLVCALACAHSVCFVELMPNDKALVVKLLKENFRISTCVAAIGSSESDIYMLQVADVGISIRHKTELLAASYADIVVESFSGLSKLLLIEGHYNYFRMSKVILIFLYKNWTLTFIQIAFTFYAKFSGCNIFNSFLLTWYNILFTTIPVFFIGILDKDLDNNSISYKPQIYTIGIHNRYFNWYKLIKHMINSLTQSIILSLFCYNIPSVIFLEGKTEDLITSGVFIYIALILTVQMQIFILTSVYSKIYYLTQMLSILFLILFLIIASETDSNLNSIGIFLTKSPYALFTIFLTSLICIVPSLAYSQFKNIFNPSLLEYLKSNIDIINEESKLMKFKHCLSLLYKPSNSLFYKIEQLKFKSKKSSLTFELPHIETEYAETFIKNNLKQIKIVIGIIALFITISIILSLTVVSIGQGYTLEKVFMLVTAVVLFVILFTNHFKKHYRIYIYTMILFGMVSRFVIGVIYKRTSFIEITLVPIFSFFVFNVHHTAMCWINALNIIFFSISVSLEFSYYYSSGQAAIYCLYSINFLISITLNSAIQSYYCEKSSRTEYELMYKLMSSVEKTHSILGIILPPFVCNQVKNGIRDIAENQNDVTIIFCDIGQFEKICNDYKPFELSRFLDRIFSLFDALCESTGVTKIETVGKTYMACAGLKESDKLLYPHLRKENHGRRALEFALAILEEISEILLKNENYLQVKIGINSGTVVAGVVGQHKPQFSLVGDTVNTASRMCSTLKNYNSIQISESTYDLVKEFPEYKFDPREVEAKGKGNIKTFIVTESDHKNSDLSAGLSNSTGRIPSSSLSFVSDKSGQLETKRINKSISPSLKSWKKKLLLNRSLEIIVSNSPTIFHQKSNIDEWEQEFRKENLEKNNKIVFVSIIIAIFTFTISLILNVLDMALFDFSLPYSVIALRILGLILLLAILLAYKSLYYSKAFIFTFIASNTVMQVFMFLMILNKTQLPIDLLCLEMVYILMLLVQVMRNPIFPTILFIVCNIVIWLTLGGLYSSFLTTFVSVLIILTFMSLHIKSKYTQEKNERNNFNLKTLGDKELKENENLLIQMMPPHVLDNLENDKAPTDRLKNVTLIYADIVGFTAWCSGKTPHQVIKMLSNLFTQFDNLCVEFDVYKVHTIGDCYVVMGYTGKRQRNPAQECINVIKMAYKMIDIIQLENLKHSSELNMRIGVHTGEVIAGVIGTSIVRYDIWGPDVLIANKMESNGTPGRVKISEDTMEMLKNRIESGFVFEKSEKVKIESLNMKKESYYLTCVDFSNLVYY